jgi:RNA polymerase sigma factor (sigma-70 family)
MTRSVPDATVEQLFDEHYAALVRLTAALLDDVGECEEIVQDAFAGLLRVDGGPAPGKEAPYLRSAVLNGARSRLRRRGVRRRHVQPVAAAAPSAEGLAVDRVEMQQVLAAVRGLPRRQSEVLLLRYHAELSELEIADTLGISTGSVKTHARRGLASLRTTLEETP